MEEAATPLPNEETTPPVTNIYFGAIRVVRAAHNAAALDSSYLSGLLFATGHRFQGLRVCFINPDQTNVCFTNLSTMTTYKQLWARSPSLSIATICVAKCKFLMVAETFPAQKGSKFSRVFPGPYPEVALSALLRFQALTLAARRSLARYQRWLAGRLIRGSPFCPIFLPCSLARRVLRREFCAARFRCCAQSLGSGVI